VKRKRPFSVTLLAIGVLSIAGLHLIRFMQALQQWQFLESLPGVSPLYLAVTGFVWAAAGLFLVISLWLGARPAPRATLAAAAAYALYNWADRIFAANVSLSVYEGFAWPFRLAGTFVLLGLVFWILSRPAARTFFRSDA
jgi:hypothetical protein